MGVMYMRTLLAQAGVAHSEFSSGEDYLAADATLEFESGAVRVQVKAGTRKPNKSGSITVPLRQDWKEKWSKCKLPVFLVYVRLEKTPHIEWIEHGDLHTLVHARAVWTRVNEVAAASVRVPLQNRLTVATFDTWVAEFNQTWAWGKAGTA